MPSLIDIRRRIKSVKNTQQITKAMKMVAAARLRKAQDRVINARPFARMTDELLRNVAAAATAGGAFEHPLLAQRPEEKIQLVLITSDRGFAGGFNANLIKAAQQFLDDNRGKTEAELYGKKGRDYFRNRDVAVSGEMTGVSERPTVEQANELAGKLIKRFSDADVDAVYLIYNEFKSVLSQKVVVKKILPVEIPEGGATREYIYEQPPAQLLNALLPEYAQLQVLQAFLESAAAEHAARMTAMDAATSNASEVIDKLTLYMNRVRQASITKEIIEVVSGAAALE